MALLFGSLGFYGLEGAWGFTVISLTLAAYFHLVARRNAALPDPASMLEHAQRLVAAGRTEEAVAVLTDALRLSPWFAEARQYREEIERAQREQPEGDPLRGVERGAPQVPLLVEPEKLDDEPRG